MMSLLKKKQSYQSSNNNFLRIAAYYCKVQLKKHDANAFGAFLSRIND